MNPLGKRSQGQLGMWALLFRLHCCLSKIEKMCILPWAGARSVHPRLWVRPPFSPVNHIGGEDEHF